jgi:DNA-binding beta-propeller fold protein YncE
MLWPVNSAGGLKTAMTPDGRTAYVDSYSSETVTPIKTTGNIPGTPIAVGAGPLGLAVTPDGPPLT